MKFIIIDLRPGYHGIRKTNFIGPFWAALSSQGMVHIIDVNKESIHVTGDTWAPLKEVSEK